MRYDIYAALTDDMPSYNKNDSLEGKIFRKVVPSNLEKNVSMIAKNEVEFEIPSEEDNIEVCANRIEEDEDSVLKDSISLCASTTNGDKVISCEEVIGFEGESNHLCYSCVEIIDNKENILILGGTVTYGDGPNAKDRILTAKLGTWVYETKFVKEYEPLLNFCSSRLDTVNAFEQLKTIQNNLKKEKYIKPENYVTITAGNDLDLSRIEVDNDGEIEPQEHYQAEYTEKFAFLNAENNIKVFEDPRTILRCLHSISNFIYIPVCDNSLYGRFNALDFIKNISKTELVQKENPKQKVNKPIMIVDPQKVDII